MKVINSVITVQMTDIDRATLYNAYNILNELYAIIVDNNCEYVSDTCGNDYDRADVALTANVLQMLASADKLEISK